MAIVVASAVLVPNYKMYLLLLGAVPIKYIAVFFFVLDILNMPDGNAGGHLAHLGGALFGYIFIGNLKKGRDLSRIFEKIGEKIRRTVSVRKTKLNVSHRRPKSDTEFINTKVDKQKMIDDILDKIARSGYDSLSKKEKELLFKISKEDL
jgi:hypothetical protein